mgnify:CR=1 FL=1
MLPTLPLDVTGRQIREGDSVVFPSKDGTSLVIANVSKITPSFVHIESEMFGKVFKYKRSFRNVYIVRGVE